MRVLVADDEQDMTRALEAMLKSDGHEVDTVYDGQAALDFGETGTYDCIVLDIMMPYRDGLDVVRTLRSKSVRTPILILTAKSTQEDVVGGLNSGADDYLTKPFVLEELVARIQAHLRRQMRSDPRRASAGPIQIGGIRMEPEEMRVTRNGVEVPLSTREFELLAYLMQNAGQTLSRERIFHDVWRTEYGDVGTVAINIKNLRAKLDPDWRYIKTVWGSGYRFVTQNGFAEEESDDRRS